MTHTYESPAVPRRVEGLIVAMARFRARSKLSLWDTDEASLAQASTASVQLLRAAAKRMRRQPWRDNQMQADRVLALTYVELSRRGAISLGVSLT